MNILKDVLPEKPYVPKDYTYKTTLLNKGKLARKNYVWLSLTVRSPRGLDLNYKVEMPKGLSKEQQEYFAAMTRRAILEQNKNK